MKKCIFMPVCQRCTNHEVDDFWGHLKAILQFSDMDREAVNCINTGPI